MRFSGVTIVLFHFSQPRLGANCQTTAANFIWHWGDNGSWKNFVLAHPPTRTAIVIFTNGSRGLHVAQRIVSASTGLDHAAFWWL